jgi:type IV pilus assembly protein PilX
MTMKAHGTSSRHGKRRQRGAIATLLAIIVLVATLLAAVALLRSVDTSNNIAGSLAFRQSVIQAGENAYQQALTLNFNEPVSDADHAGLGYYATLQVPNSQGLPDVLVTQMGAPATNLGTTAPVTGLPSGYTGYYVVERLCPPGTTATSITACIVPGAVIQGGSSSNQTKDNGPPFSTGAFAAFRLSVGVAGPKNTLGYVQTVLR